MVATLLWFDQQLKTAFTFPKTPATVLQLRTAKRIPAFSVKPDMSKPVLAVDIYYTQHGQAEEIDRENTMSRFWHSAEARRTGNTWIAELPVANTGKPLWVFANVLYPLEAPVAGAGYYYSPYSATQFNLSSLMSIATPDQLQASEVKVSLRPSSMIETFAPGWQKEWFTYDLSGNWARSTHKVYDEIWKAPAGAKLALDVRSTEANTMIIGLDTYAAEVLLKGGPEWQSVLLRPNDFVDADGATLPGWEGIRELRLR
jgi:hypothetical protein